MLFETLVQSADRLRAALHASTGRHLVEQVSLDTPDEDGSEAAFIKTVLWGYVFWFEACHPAGRHLLDIVRNTSPSQHASAARVFKDIQSLRTYATHNLLPSSRSDQYQLDQARAWLAENGAAARDWSACTTKLCATLATNLSILCDHWEAIIASPEDSGVAIQRLVAAVDRDWPAHMYDRMIDEAASRLGLAGLNPVAFRQQRLDDWRKIASLFADRAAAEAALARAIQQELEAKFGQALLPKDVS